MIRLKTQEQIEILRQGGKILHKILQEIKAHAKEGMSTFDLDKFAQALMETYGVEPVFKNYRPVWSSKAFPASICTSLNEVVVHGVPSKNTILKQGDILSIDCGIKYQGLITDAAITFGIGKISKQAQKLLDITQKALAVGIKQAKPGKKINDIGKEIEKYVVGQGFSVVKELVGHGVGFSAHEDPEVPNYFDSSASQIIEEGLVIAIEPMIAAGSGSLIQYHDESFATKDSSLAAHFEHTVAATKNGTIVLTN